MIKLLKLIFISLMGIMPMVIGASFLGTEDAPKTINIVIYATNFKDIAKKIESNHNILGNIIKKYCRLSHVNQLRQCDRIDVNENRFYSIHNIQSSTRQINNDIDFTFVHETAGIPQNDRDSFYQDTDKYLHEIMVDLVNIGILDEDDLKTMNYKIKVTYQQTCDVSEGDFHITRNSQTGKIIFKNIKLIIAYCDKYDTSEKKKRHVQQILAHELGHYVYFFKDNNPSEFSEICRKDGKIRCLPEEFVSDYSMQSEQEDYAESFAYWYLYNFGNKYDRSTDNSINKRFIHFQNLFKRINNTEF